MSPKRTSWDRWRWPTIIAGSLAAAGAIGTAIVKTSIYLTLPDRVDASEKKNLEQDTNLTKLTVIESQNQQMINLLVTQQQAPLPVEPVIQRKTTKRGQQFCCREDCETPTAWSRCGPP